MKAERLVSNSGDAVSKRASLVASVALTIGLLAIAGCSSYHTSILNETIAQERILQPILLLPPVTGNPELRKYAAALGKDFEVELARVAEHTIIQYGPDIEALKPSLTWENIIINGDVNADEVCAMARNIHCASVVAVELRSVNSYPPQRAVIYMTWFDTQSGDPIARLYNDVDLSDWKTNRIFGNYIGYGPGQMLQEELFYSEDNLQTCALSPERFRQFAAAYSVNLIFGQIRSGFWYRFWNTMF